MTLHIRAADLPIHPYHLFMGGRLTVQPLRSCSRAVFVAAIRAETCNLMLFQYFRERTNGHECI